MKLTSTQKKAMKELALCKVVRRKMWRTEKQLGYTSTSANKRYYDINIANDTGSREVEDIVLLHEIGHCYFGHNDLNIKEELLLVKSMCDGAGLPFSTTLLYGGPMRFLNIAMDLEINSKLLTVGNIKAMKKFGFELCTPEGFQIETGESYRSYYMPLLEKAKDFMDKSPLFGSENGEEEEDDGDSDSDGSSDTEKDKGGSGKSKSKGKGKGKGDDTSDKIPGTRNDTGDDLSNDSPLTGIEEIDDALLKEGYIGGDIKAKDKSNKSDTSTVKEKEKEIEEAEDGESDSGKKKNIGDSNAFTSSIVIEAENTPKEIEKFLRSIIGNSYDFLMDPMRLWNRGSRDRSSGVIYNSLKQAPQRKRKKLGILVDISGSMDITNIKNAAQSLKDCSKILDKGSMFVTWNTDLGQQFPIMNIPDQIRVGGGTDMVAGINYLVKQGFTDIVVYSDFETYGLETVNPKDYRLYSIVVNDRSPSVGDGVFKSYIAKNKKVLFLK